MAWTAPRLARTFSIKEQPSYNKISTKQNTALSNYLNVSAICILMKGGWSGHRNSIYSIIDKVSNNFEEDQDDNNDEFQLTKENELQI